MTQLTPEQEEMAHKIDTVGLGLLAAPVAAGLLGRLKGRPGMLGHIGEKMHRFHEGIGGPLTDLAGLALIAPPIMHPLARRLAPVLSPAEEAGGELPKVAYAAGARAALSKLGLDQKSKGGYSKTETRKLYPKASGKGLEERHEGLNEELEHRDITRGNDARTKKIVDAHLEERPDYYSRLSRAMR